MLHLPACRSWLQKLTSVKRRQKRGPWKTFYLYKAARFRNGFMMFHEVGRLQYKCIRIFWIIVTVWIAGSDLVWKLVHLPFLRHLWFLLLVSGNLGPGAWSTDEQISLQWKDSSTIRVLQHHEISPYFFVQWDCTSRHPWLVTSPLLCKRQVWTIPGRIHENPSSHDRNRRLKTQVGDLRTLVDLWKKMICENTTFEWFILVEWERSCRIWGNWIVGIRWL